MDLTKRLTIAELANQGNAESSRVKKGKAEKCRVKNYKVERDRIDSTINPNKAKGSTKSSTPLSIDPEEREDDSTS